MVPRMLEYLDELRLKRLDQIERHGMTWNDMEPQIASTIPFSDLFWGYSEGSAVYLFRLQLEQSKQLCNGFHICYLLKV